MMRREIFVGLLMLGFCGALYWGAMDIESEEARFLPLVTIMFMVALSLLHFVEMWLKYRRRPVTAQASPLNTRLLKSLLLTFVSMLLFLWALDVIGFYTTCFLYFVLLPPVLVPAERSLKASGRRLLTGGLFIAALYLLFGKFMLVQTPVGILF